MLKQYVTALKKKINALGPVLHLRTLLQASNFSSWNKRVFQEIYRGQAWGSAESVSGTGSEIKSTEDVRRIIPKVISDLGALSVLDAPCGDFNWMKLIVSDKFDYVGVDIVPEIIAANKKYEHEGVRFMCADIVHDRMPVADLIICRDCLVHLSYHDIRKVLKNFKKSGNYLLMTTFPAVSANKNIYSGRWRPLDFQKPPFDFPPPLASHVEAKYPTTRPCGDKYLALWKLSDL